MTENKRYTAQVVISIESIEKSQDMAVVYAEKGLVADLYLEADMPRDFRIQIRHEPFQERQSIRVVAMLTVIDPTNPAVEEDKDWFKWMKQAPVRMDEGVYYDNKTVANHTHAVGNSGLNNIINQIYGPVIKEQLERSQQMHSRDLQTFDALSGLGSIKAEIQRDLDKKLVQSLADYQAPAALLRSLDPVEEVPADTPPGTVIIRRSGDTA
jgi:hypothetical protein